MFVKSIAAGLAASALFATVAFAQTPTTTTSTATSTASSSSYQGDWRASKVVGLNVYNDKNESIGSINELLMDKSGNVKIAVLSVGGFLGVGAHYVAIPWEKLKFTTEPVAYTGAGAANAPANRPAATTTTGTAATTSKVNLWYPDHAVFNATKDELKAMPEFKYE